MLRTLRVSDLAIIDEIELVFEPGFNVLTGETGAGKSILLHALDVALGGRPDADLVRSGAEEAVVEALFTGVTSSGWESLEAAGIKRGDGDELVIRRVIAAGAGAARTRTAHSRIWHCCAISRRISFVSTARTSTRRSGASRGIARCSTRWAASAARSRRCAAATSA